MAPSADTQPLKKKPENETADEPEENTEGKGLKRDIGLLDGCNVIIGCIIGSGIFVSPTGVQEQAGSVGVSLIVWLAAGMFTAIGAYCYAELGTLIRRSGGDYAYILEAFGPFCAFIRLWIEAIVVRPVTITIVSLTFAIYVLKPFYPDCSPPEYLPVMLAILLIVLMTAINCISVKAAKFVQNAFTYAKVVALVLIILTGAWLLIRGRPENYESFENLWENTPTDMTKISLAFYAGLFAYSGWNFLNYIVDEMKNPKRDLPLSIAISIPVCTIIYTLTNVALYTTLSPEEMLETPAVAVLFANKNYGWFGLVMPLAVACSTIGTTNGLILTSSRLFYVGAREDQMPFVFGMINRKTSTPIPAVIFTGLLSMGYLLLSKDVYSLMNYMQISYWLAIAGAILSLFWLRRKMPNAPRPIKVNLFWPAIFFIGCCLLVIIPIYAAFKDTMIGLAIMFSAVPVYLIFIQWKNKPKFVEKISECITIFCQKVFLVDYTKDD
ncbi:hypothetical protein WR25_05480 isoform A [Diploscapter pachys]|uniref:Amino acid permease/ SLC12A domain-containing protein n=2 Tax=Diploscapter pachys TaxID=2018661 RepID=A0A2A2LWQ9_9BILA|nr:hypothetical protein WR25_05480 isoform A [Diploscapter pachys]